MFVGRSNVNKHNCIRYFEPDVLILKKENMNKKIFLAILISLFTSLNLFAQKEKMQSVFIYNFITKFVEWPASDKSGDFVIGVLGNSPIIDEFKALAASRTVGSQKIVVKKFNSASEISACQVLYISDSKTAEIGAALGKVGNTLVISDCDGGARMGAAINFVLIDNKQKFELKTANATSKKLKVSPDLEKMAIMVN